MTGKVDLYSSFDALSPAPFDVDGLTGVFMGEKTTIKGNSFVRVEHSDIRLKGSDHRWIPDTAESRAVLRAAGFNLTTGVRQFPEACPA